MRSESLRASLTSFCVYLAELKRSLGSLCWARHASDAGWQARGNCRVSDWPPNGSNVRFFMIWFRWAKLYLNVIWKLFRICVPFSVNLAYFGAKSDPPVWVSTLCSRDMHTEIAADTSRDLTDTTQGWYVGHKIDQIRENWYSLISRLFLYLGFCVFVKNKKSWQQLIKNYKFITIWFRFCQIWDLFDLDGSVITKS